MLIVSKSCWQRIFSINFRRRKYQQYSEPNKTSHPSNCKNPFVPILYSLNTVFFLCWFILILQTDSCTLLWNFTLPLEKGSSDLAGIRVQDDPTSVQASLVCDRGTFNLVLLCVLHLLMFISRGENKGIHLVLLDQMLLEGARKWAQRVNHEIRIDGIKNPSSFKVNNSLSCSHAGLYLHKQLLSSCGCKWGTFGGSACLALLFLWAGSVTKSRVQSTALSEVSGLNQMLA